MPVTKKTDFEARVAGGLCQGFHFAKLIARDVAL